MGVQIPLKVIEAMLNLSKKQHRVKNSEHKFIIYKDAYDKEGEFVHGRSKLRTFMYLKK